MGCKNFIIMGDKSWRQIYAPVIAAIISQNGDKSIPQLKNMLKDAYPRQYGYHQQAWKAECADQLKKLHLASVMKEIEKQISFSKFLLNI